MTRHSFIAPGVFGPEAIEVIGKAYDAALKELQDTGHPNVVPEAMARRIIAEATHGERDPIRLRAAALTRAVAEIG
jgi:hypothetical protein